VIMGGTRSLSSIRRGEEKFLPVCVHSHLIRCIAADALTEAHLALIVSGNSDPDDPTPGMPHRPG